MSPFNNEYPASYKQMIQDEKEKLAKELPELAAAIVEGILRFSSDMQEHSGVNLPSKCVAFAAFVLPNAFKKFEHKLRYEDHLEVMIEYE